MPEGGSPEPLAQAHHEGAADEAEVPAYLYTSNSDNLPYYRSHGYEVTGESTLPGGGPNWFMEPPAAV